MYRTRMIGLVVASAIMLSTIVTNGVLAAGQSGAIAPGDTYRNSIGVGATIPGYLELVEQQPGIAADIGLLVRANTPWTLMARLNAAPGVTARIRQAASGESWTTLHGGSSVQVPCTCFHFAGDNALSFDSEPITPEAVGAVVEFTIEPATGNATNLWPAKRTARGVVASGATSAGRYPGATNYSTLGRPAATPASTAVNWAPITAQVSVLPD